MQSEQESDDSIIHSLTLQREKQEKTRKIIKEAPMIAKLIYQISAKNIINSSGLLVKNMDQKEYQESWNILLEGPPGNEKRSLTENIAQYLEIEPTIISIRDIVSRYPYTQQVDFLEQQISPHLAQGNRKHIFIIKDIDLLQSFKIIDERENHIIYNANRKLHEYIEKAEEKNKSNRKNRFIFLATTENIDGVSERIRTLFNIIRVNNPDINSRKNLLIDLLKSDKNLNSQACISDKNLVSWAAKKTDGFSIRDLKNVIETASSHAYSRIFIPDQKQVTSHVACLQKNDLIAAIKTTCLYTIAAKKYKEHIATRWWPRRIWRESGAIS